MVCAARAENGKRGACNGEMDVRLLRAASSKHIDRVCNGCCGEAKLCGTSPEMAASARA